MTFVKHHARLSLALFVAMLLVLSMAACEDPNGMDPGTDPGMDPGLPGDSPGF